jgi:hypothetical protein
MEEKEMKKISRQAATALYNGNRYSNSNTIVPQAITITIGDYTQTIGEMYLHGNKIAHYIIDVSNGNAETLKISLCGWPTVTTRDRINAVLNRFGVGYQICQRDGRQMLFTDDGTRVIEISSKETVVLRQHLARGITWYRDNK